MSTSPLRWGIASAGKISHDFSVGLASLPSTDHVIQAVAARDSTRAKNFAKLHGIPNAYNNYDALAKDPKVDVVYIGVTNPQHYETIVLMLNHNKAVLCEKPLTLNAKQTRKVVELARKKKLFLMEAVWSRTFPIYKELQKQLDQGVIGDVKQVVVGFGVDLTGVERIEKKSLGGGVILDLGVYTLQFTQFIYRGLKPLKVVSAGHLYDEQVDKAVNSVLVYPGDRMASLHMNGVVTLPNEAVVTGTKGVIRIPNFWCPTEMTTPSGTIRSPLPEPKFTCNFVNSVGLRYEAEEVRQCLKQNLTENPSMPLNESIELAELMDTLREQVGVRFPDDD